MNLKNNEEQAAQTKQVLLEVVRIDYKIPKPDPEHTRWESIPGGSVKGWLAILPFEVLEVVTTNEHIFFKLDDADIEKAVAVVTLIERTWLSVKEKYDKRSNK